jgi:hypothetical protein
MNRIIMFMFMLPLCTQMHGAETISATLLLHALVDKNNQPTTPLLKLLKKTGCPHDNTLPSIVASAQKNLLRQPGKERWENKTNALLDDAYLLLFEGLYLIQEIVPSQKSYDYALLLGGVLDDVRTRLTYLISLWDKGIRFNSLVILTGQRPLDSRIENEESLVHNNSKNVPPPTTESEMIQCVFAQTNLPTEWKNLLSTVDMPMQKMADGSCRRPNTEDTVVEWLRGHNPRPGTILAISNQPFIGYQHAVLRKNLPDFRIETVGPAYEDNESISTILDAAARWIYNENQIIHNQRAKY